LFDFGNENFAMECCEKLTALQAWPFSKISVEPWLSNFERDDRPFAAHMVSQFLYLNDQIVDAQFLAAFQNISNLMRTDWIGFTQAHQSWHRFMDNCLIVPVQGEQPNPSDSGYIFARKARQILGIDPCQLIELEDAIHLLSHGSARPIVFVDDFVGSGEQFTKTLTRTSKKPHTFGKSIYKLCAANNTNIYYCNVAVTKLGHDRILRDFPNVILSTGNLIGNEYNWISSDSGMWPNDKRNQGIAIIEKYSKKLGYTDSNGDENDWKGFHELGLGLAFEHSTPDASLPIFFTENDNWKPLVTRR
tara:strand:+ start:1244 stop:2155 length:912 start_codon:yes stop_codon:yes gene_type:complete